MSEMSVLDKTGDTRIQWDKANAEEVAAALARFNELRVQGFAAYRVDASGQGSEVLHAFDREAERIIFRPPMVGG